MARQQHGEVGEYHACKECRGLWIPRTYLIALKRRAAQEWKRQDALTPVPVRTHSIPLNCPECASALVPRVHEMVPIDVCAQCRAVWLDGDEILHLGKGTAMQEIREKKKLETVEATDRGWSELSRVSDLSLTSEVLGYLGWALFSIFD